MAVFGAGVFGLSIIIVGLLLFANATKVITITSKLDPSSINDKETQRKDDAWDIYVIKGLAVLMIGVGWLITFFAFAGIRY